MRTVFALIVATALSACAAPAYYYPTHQGALPAGYGPAEASIYVSPPLISTQVYPISPPVIYRPAYRGYYGPPPVALRPPPTVYVPPAAGIRPPAVVVPPVAVQPYRPHPAPWLHLPTQRGRRA